MNRVQNICRALLVSFLCSVIIVPHAARAHTPLTGTPYADTGTSLETMIGQMIMVGFRGTGQPPHAENLPLLLEDIKNGHVGGVILFDRDWSTKEPGRNIYSAAQVTTLTAMLQAAAPQRLLVSIDQEGGKVRRLRPEHGFPDSPSARSLGVYAPHASRQAGKLLGTALKHVGINLNFAPCADVDINPESPAIGLADRSFSASPAHVAAHAFNFAVGLNSAGVAACYKHFPGHGSAETDTHKDLTDITRTWNAHELLPYTAKYRPHNSPLLIMTGHLMNRNLDPVYPASLSYAMTTILLRKQLGWRGVVVTDDLQMSAITKHFTEKDAIKHAVLAGADIVLLGNNLTYNPLAGRDAYALLLELVQHGDIPAERIYESWARIQTLKRQLGL